VARLPASAGGKHPCLRLPHRRDRLPATDLRAVLHLARVATDRVHRRHLESRRALGPSKRATSSCSSATSTLPVPRARPRHEIQPRLRRDLPHRGHQSDPHADPGRRTRTPTPNAGYERSAPTASTGSSSSDAATSSTSSASTAATTTSRGRTARCTFYPRTAAVPRCRTKLLQTSAVATYSADSTNTRPPEFANPTPVSDARRIYAPHDPRFRTRQVAQRIVALGNSN
jgi:hypothetical protein